jgi:hypothetical protein
MRLIRTCYVAAIGTFCMLSGRSLNADESSNRARAPEPASFRLAQATERRTSETRTQEETPAGERTTTVTVTEERGEPYGFRGTSDFFNVREANPTVPQGAWQFEATSTWVTRSDGTDDDIFLAPSVRYGLTEDIYAELQVLPLNLGDGGEQGNGELGLLLFGRVIRETDVCPAVAFWGRARIPTGDGSEKMDVEVHGNVTKTITPDFRVHFEAFAMSANGGRGDTDIGRRHFQWGAGPGFDYRFNECTYGVLNYFHRSSEFEGNHNQNILEAGIVYQVNECHTIKAAVDVGLDGAEETPNFAAKVQYTFQLP